MSTRSAIAQPAGDGWAGVYCHSDGCPTWNGRRLWEAYHREFGRDVASMRKALIDDHPQGWSLLLERPYGPDEPEMPIVCTCPSPESKCDPLFIEWAYVLGDRELWVYEASQTKPGLGVTNNVDTTYVHRLVGAFPWDGDEPDWEAIKRRVQAA